MKIRQIVSFFVVFIIFIFVSCSKNEPSPTQPTQSTNTQTASATNTTIFTSTMTSTPTMAFTDTYTPSDTITDTNTITPTFTETFTTTPTFTITFTATLVPTWQYVGSSQFTGDETWNQRTQLTGNGHTLYLACTINDSYANGYVYKYSSGSWSVLGGEKFVDVYLNYVDCAVSGNDVYVVYQDRSGANEAKSRKYTYTTDTWSDLGGSMGGNSYCENIAISNTEDVYAGFFINGTNSMYIKRYDSTWINTEGTPLNAPGAIGDIDIGIDGTDIYALILYNEVNIGNKNILMLKKKNGSDWETIGGSYFGNPGASNITLRVYSGIPYVSFIDETNTVRVYYYNGAWTQLGSGFAASRFGANGLWVDGGGVYIGFSRNSDSYPVVYKYTDGEGWVMQGTPLVNEGATCVSVYVYSGVIYASFRHNSSSKISVMKLE